MGEPKTMLSMHAFSESERQAGTQKGESSSHELVNIVKKLRFGFYS